MSDISDKEVEEILAQIAAEEGEQVEKPKVRTEDADKSLEKTVEKSAENDDSASKEVEPITEKEEGKKPKARRGRPRKAKQEGAEELNKPEDEKEEAAAPALEESKATIDTGSSGSESLSKAIATSSASAVASVSKVVSFVDAEKLKHDVSIDPLRLNDALMNHAALFVHYATQHANAVKQFEKSKSSLDIVEAKLDYKYRKQLKEDNPKTTEGQIKAAIIDDPNWKVANERVIDCRAVRDLAASAKEAFSMRRDTLLQLAKDHREERLGQLRVEQEQGQIKATMESLQG